MLYSDTKKIVERWKIYFISLFWTLATDKCKWGRITVWSPTLHDIEYIVGAAVLTLQYLTNDSSTALWARNYLSKSYVKFHSELVDLTQLDLIRLGVDFLFFGQKNNPHLASTFNKVPMCLEFCEYLLGVWKMSSLSLNFVFMESRACLVVGWRVLEWNRESGQGSRKLVGLFINYVI